jgi:hypothetical protein
MVATPPGFGIKIIHGAKNMPYPVEVKLPPIQGERDPAIPIKTRGPIIDLVIPDIPDRHAHLGQSMEQWSLLESMLHFHLKI